MNNKDSITPTDFLSILRMMTVHSFFALPPLNQIFVIHTSIGLFLTFWREKKIPIRRNNILRYELWSAKKDSS